MKVDYPSAISIVKLISGYLGELRSYFSEKCRRRWLRG
jgi:hypothetical protein